MADSLTRNAAAISVWLRPHTARRVSAIWESLDSDGWQHANIIPSNSSSL